MSNLVYADPLDEYKEAYNEGWKRYYMSETSLEEEGGIPEPPLVIYHSGADASLSLQQQGLIDGTNDAGRKYLNEKWESYSWWEKILDPETWFLITFIL
jgi:hypothetical protein